MTPKNYDLTFHYFRAFAIVSVMLTHMWVGPVLAGSEDAAKLQDSLRLCLFHSATIYFVFISGYLFDFVNRRKGQFSPLRFYKSKIVNVFCPYFILSLLLLAAGWISHHWFGYDIPFINDGTPVASLWDVLRCLAYGSASLVPYWYIPFIMTVFSVGPLIFHLPTGLLQKILLPASVLPLMVPRLLVSPLRNLCFFVPIFLMGVYCARNRDACMAFIRRHLSAIRVTAVLTSLLIVADHYFGSFMPNIEGAYCTETLYRLLGAGTAGRHGQGSAGPGLPGPLQLPALLPACHLPGHLPGAPVPGARRRAARTGLHHRQPHRDRGDSPLHPLHPGHQESHGQTLALSHRRLGQRKACRGYSTDSAGGCRRQ